MRKHIAKAAQSPSTVQSFVKERAKQTHRKNCSKYLPTLKKKTLTHKPTERKKLNDNDTETQY
jgi:hypothetical protein